MKETTLTCDRCDAIATIEDSYWQLEFSREVIVEDMTEFISETWDLCEACYAVVAPNVFLIVQQPEDEG